jgi:hypothetical protein
MPIRSRCWVTDRNWLAAEPSVALDRAGITVVRDITFLAAGPASERSRSADSAAPYPRP